MAAMRSACSASSAASPLPSCCPSPPSSPAPASSSPAPPSGASREQARGARPAPPSTDRCARRHLAFILLSYGVGMRRVLSLATVLATIVALFASGPVHAGGRDRAPIRFATFNASLNRSAPGALTADLQRALDSDPDNDSAQLQAVLDIVSSNDPDVLLINEFDTGTDGDAATVALFAELAGYPYFFTAPSNTGIPSGFDLNNNGTIGGGDDALGFGAFPGQFGMAVFSKFPIDVDGARTFQGFLWKDMPGALLPTDPLTGAVVVLARGVGRAAALVEEPLGRPDRHRSRHGALPRQPSDTARVRRRRKTATAGATSTRSASGPTTSSPVDGPATSTTTKASAEDLRGRRPIRDRRRSELRPPRRRLDPRRHPATARSPTRQRPQRAHQRGRGRSRHLAGRRQPHPPQRSTIRHGRLRRFGTGQPARRLRAALQAPAMSSTVPCSGHRRANPGRN